MTIEGITEHELAEGRRVGSEMVERLAAEGVLKVAHHEGWGFTLFGGTLQNPASIVLTAEELLILGTGLIQMASRELRKAPMVS